MPGIYSTDQLVSGLFGSIVISNPGVWSVTSNSSFANFPANSYGVTPVLKGNASVPSTTIPGISFVTLPAGNYLVIVEACLGSGGAGTGSSLFRITDGTNNSASARILMDSPSATNFTCIGNVIGQFSYSTNQSNITFQVQGKNDASEARAEIFADSSDFTIHVYRMPILPVNAGV